MAHDHHEMPMLTAEPCVTERSNGESHEDSGSYPGWKYASPCRVALYRTSQSTRVAPKSS